MKKISTRTNQQLKKDVKSFLEIYPGYSYYKKYGEKYSVIKGEIDVCDTMGNYLDSFNIEIYLDNDRYPYFIPIVKERSTKIKRHEDWHIDKDGICCLDIEHELEYKAKKGIEFIDFYQNSIYPFFANTVYKMNFGKYSNGEYRHFFKGVQQFYSEKLLLDNKHLIIGILNAILINALPGRNDRPCICGLDKKFKRCHLKCVEFLKSLSKERLLKDLAGFEEIC
ncbi:hypothetical protein DHD05_10580 [Arenibacter sp. N53]|uniref:SEC-C metal-binding domain-containing protein n=1 Tax=Arenibacter TaxID=178469 RepID=UPI000CD46B9D|nr:MULTISPECIES: SEC-C metal-binding domain-containing protein [Arenibacter]MCM4152038.1 hypothetical protein [Arenibacter sp. N53]